MEVCIRDQQRGGPPSKNHGPRINHQIRAHQVRLVRDDEGPEGTMSLEDAKRLAQDAGLDLVEISPTADPPVVKLIDYGKFKYMAQKKANESKKKQVVVAVKEIQFRPNIEKHDIEVKLKKIHEFLDAGDKVKLIMQFRGREMANSHIGKAKFDEILQSLLAAGAVVEDNPKMMGNRLTGMIAPGKKK